MAQTACCQIVAGERQRSGRQDRVRRSIFGERYDSTVDKIGEPFGNRGGGFAMRENPLRSRRSAVKATSTKPDARDARCRLRENPDQRISSRRRRRSLVPPRKHFSPPILPPAPQSL